MGEITYKAVWQAAETQDQVEAMRFWADNNLLGGDADQAARAAQLCVLARDGGGVIGLSTIRVRPLEMLRQRLAMFRCAVAPDFRRRGVATQLAVHSRAALEGWSLANPDQQVQGMACVVRGLELRAKQAEPFWPLSGLGLAGYNEAGDQIRIAWFQHAMI